MCDKIDKDVLNSDLKQMTDVCRQFLKDAFGLEELESQLKAYFRNDNSKFHWSLLDALFVLDSEVECVSVKPVDKFKSLLKVAQTYLPDDVLRIGIESLVEEDKLMSARIVKTKTRLYYKQLKFNLLREESEGYAKLVVELNQPIDSSFNHLVAFDRIRSLIGQFNLDPNRVLDIILESFEARPQYQNLFMSLIRVYNPSVSDTGNLLGFKFTFYQAVSKRREDTPVSLYRVAALLINENRLDMLSLLTYLQPTLEWVFVHHKKLQETAAQHLKKASSTALSSQDENNDISEEAEEEKLVRNQKLMLLLSLLEVGDWTHAKQLLDRLPECYAVRHPEIAKALCALIDHEVNDLYVKYCKQYCLQTIQLQDSSRKKFSTAPLGNLEDMITIIFPVIHYLDVYIATDPVLVVKMVRLCSVIITEIQKNNSSNLQQYYGHIIDLCEILLPSLSIMSCANCAVSEQMWGLISQLPYQIRYRIYGRWKSGSMKKHPKLMISKAEIMGKTKYIMKRLSKETTKQAGRQLAKLCHTHPTVVFEYILNQIQQFENLIQPVVESLKFLTNLSHDVLAYSVIEQLASPEKERMKVSEINVSSWLQSLATFVGVVFKKYNIELTGVLQYVANQLKAGKSYDLLVLREIIQNMSGVETTSGLTKEQLEALAGGDLLKQEGGSLSQVKNIKRSTNRLKEALLQEDLVVCLCILMAQQRGSIIYKESIDVHLKLVGQMVDQCQESLVQFGNFLASNLKAEDYIKRMPQVDELLYTYHLDHDAAFFLARPMYQHAIQTRYDELKKAEKLAKSLTTEKKAQYYLEACASVLNPFVTRVSQICFSPKVWASISPRFYVTFWTLSMYDLNVPTASYDREIEKLRRTLEQLDEGRDLSDNKRRKEKERCQQYETKLMEEQRRQQEHVTRVMERLKQEKDEWFPKTVTKGQTVCNVLQLCILPRCMFTDMDAIYCAKMYLVMHQLRTPNFWTVYGFDRIYVDTLPIIAGLTENESHHYGRFLFALLDQVMKWYHDKALFDRECGSFASFTAKYKDQPQNEDLLTHMQYKHAVFKWHLRITILLPVYPAVQDHYEDIEKAVTKVREEQKQKRQDLHVLAASYWGHLRGKKTNLVYEEDFHQVDDRKKKVLQLKRSQAAAAAKQANTAEKDKDNDRGPSINRPLSMLDPLPSGSKEASPAPPLMKTPASSAAVSSNAVNKVLFNSGTSTKEKVVATAAASSGVAAAVNGATSVSVSVVSRDLLSQKVPASLSTVSSAAGATITTMNSALKTSNLVAEAKPPALPAKVPSTGPTVATGDVVLVNETSAAKKRTMLKPPATVDGAKVKAEAKPTVDQISSAKMSQPTENPRKDTPTSKLEPKTSPVAAVGSTEKPAAHTANGVADNSSLKVPASDSPSSVSPSQKRLSRKEKEAREAVAEKSDGGGSKKRGSAASSANKPHPSPSTVKEKASKDGEAEKSDIVVLSSAVANGEAVAVSEEKRSRKAEPASDTDIKRRKTEDEKTPQSRAKQHQQQASDKEQAHATTTKAGEHHQRESRGSRDRSRERSGAMAASEKSTKSSQIDDRKRSLEKRSHERSRSPRFAQSSPREQAKRTPGSPGKRDHEKSREWDAKIKDEKRSSARKKR